MSIPTSTLAKFGSRAKPHTKKTFTGTSIEIVFVTNYLISKFKVKGLVKFFFQRAISYLSVIL
jgi:hypothetical protein